MQSRFIALALLAALAPAAWGQAAKADSAASETAMERAQRAAAGPLKAIQQAARIRRRGDPEPAALAAVIAASAAAATGAAAVATPDRAGGRSEPPVVDAVLELGPRGPVAAEAATVAPLVGEALAVAVAAVLPATALPSPLPDVPTPQPRVLETFEPGIPPALLEQGPRGTEVEAELSLRADGSVAAVTLLPPVPRAWQRYIIAALERWRYEPMGGPATHRVRLVFSAGER